MTIEGIPEGYDLVRIGYPGDGEIWISDSGPKTCYNEYPLEQPVAILTRLAAWRRIGDASVPTLPYLKARFKTYEDDPWKYSSLVAYRPGRMRWGSGDGKWYRFCEIQTGD